MVTCKAQSKGRKALDHLESTQGALCASDFLQISELSLLKTFFCQRISVSLTSLTTFCAFLREKKERSNKQTALSMKFYLQ